MSYLRVGILRNGRPVLSCPTGMTFGGAGADGAVV